MCRGPIVRHVQLKVSLTDSSTRKITASLRLLERPSGCILWLLVTKKLEVQSFLWFGSEPGKPLPDITDMELAQHVKGNADGIKLDRNNHRRLPQSEFAKLGSIDEVYSSAVRNVAVTQLVAVERMSGLPALVATGGEHAAVRFLEFFASAIRNPHTRRAYAWSVAEFLSWCANQDALVAWMARHLDIPAAGNTPKGPGNDAGAFSFCSHLSCDRM